MQKRRPSRAFGRGRTLRRLGPADQRLGTGIEPVKEEKVKKATSRFTVEEQDRLRREAQAKYGKKAITEAKKIELYEALGLSTQEARAAVQVDKAVFDYLTVSDEATEKRLLEAAKAIGLSEVEAAEFSKSINRR